MPIYGQNHVKQFIADNELTPAMFQAHTSTGAHTEYVIAAARKRGLTVKKFGAGYYFYDGGLMVGSMRSMLSSLVSSTAVACSADKGLTKSLFESLEIPVPHGQVFKLDRLTDAMEFFEALNTPVVVKPADGAAGDGITTGVTTREHLAAAWEKAKSATSRHGSILIEQYVSGIDVRAFVIGGRVVAATTRLPPFVIGDGKTTVVDLIESKRLTRRKNAYLARMPIVPDWEWLRGAGFTEHSVPPEGDVVLLSSTVNLHQGGENVDITQQLSPELKDLAVRAAAAVPGLTVGGIDLLVQSPRNAEGAVVLEANTKANISVHHLPAYGTAVDAGSAILDEMLHQAWTKARMEGRFADALPLNSSQ